MLLQVARIFFALFLLAVMVTITHGQSSLTAKTNSFQPASGAASGNENDRSRDGLVGPVRRIRTEVVKLSTSSGKVVEDPKRAVLETSEYDLKGSKIQDQYFPIAGATLTGREVYKYDDKGNISEMTLVNADGSLVSKEVYKYDFDTVGNWVKMMTSVAVVENGKIAFEPTEATYRTISYYLDASVAKMLDAPAGSAPAQPKSDAATQPAKLPSPTTEVKSSSPANSNASRSGNEKKIVAALPPPVSVAIKGTGAVAQPLVSDVHLSSDTSKKVAVDSEPPPPRPLLKPVSGGVLNGMALSLPAPTYPEQARRLRVSGLVEVEVIVDETGKVISAKALSGPSALRDVAVQAALRARFTPTKLSGLPVKISGRINYNFSLPQ
jgi:TonB family protein